MYHIYYITNKKNEPFYVGVTCNLKVRFREHKNKLKAKNIFDFESAVDKRHAYYLEGFYIQTMKAWGFVLVNKSKVFKSKHGVPRWVLEGKPFFIPKTKTASSILDTRTNEEKAREYLIKEGIRILK